MEIYHNPSGASSPDPEKIAALNKQLWLNRRAAGLSRADAKLIATIAHIPVLTIETLAGRTRTSRRTVQMRLARLIARGIVIVIRQIRPDGGDCAPVRLINPAWLAQHAGTAAAADYRARAGLLARRAARRGGAQFAGVISLFLRKRETEHCRTRKCPANRREERQKPLPAVIAERLATIGVKPETIAQLPRYHSPEAIRDALDYAAAAPRGARNAAGYFVAALRGQWARWKVEITNLDRARAADCYADAGGRCPVRAGDSSSKEYCPACPHCVELVWVAGDSAGRKSAAPVIPVRRTTAEDIANAAAIITAWRAKNAARQADN